MEYCLGIVPGTHTDYGARPDEITVATWSTRRATHKPEVPIFRIAKERIRSEITINTFLIFNVANPITPNIAKYITTILTTAGTPKSKKQVSKIRIKSIPVRAAQIVVEVIPCAPAQNPIRAETRTRRIRY